MALFRLKLCLLTLTATFAQDPCDTKQSLGNLEQRVMGYNLSTSEVPISDYRLPEGWYILTGGLQLATKPDLCGTLYNWWIQETLPSNAGEVKICQNDGADSCAYSKKISVKKCPNGYAYELPPTDADMEAYCIENVGPSKPNDAPDISLLKPTISVEAVKIASVPQKYRLDFFCNFEVPDDIYKNLFYDVEWNLHSGVSKLSSLRLIQNVDYESKAKFDQRTKLTEDHLKENFVFKLGFTLSCTIKARKSQVGATSRVVDSPPKFCGIKIMTPTPIRVSEDSTAKIQFKLTVPFGCDDRYSCSFDMQMVVPKKGTQPSPCLLSDLVQQLPVAGRGCGIKFLKVNDVVEFEVAAAFGENIKLLQNRVYDLIFSSANKIPHHHFMQNYQLPPIKVELSVDQTLLQGKECHAVSDPHMMTFDQWRYENQVAGTFIMYRHKELEAEVQTKTKACYSFHDNFKPHCNCGVAVRAGRDIFVIDNCDKTKMTARFVYCDDSVLKRQIKRTNNIYEVLLPHGTYVKMNIHDPSEGFINVRINPSLVDLNKTEGLCGLFDNDTSNDITPRSGSHETFNESWRVQNKEDLFNPANYVIKNGWSEELYFCDCSVHNLTLTANTQCFSERKCKVQKQSGTPVNIDMCDFKTERKKRETHSTLFDGYTDPTTAYVPSKQISDNQLRQHGNLLYHSVRKRGTTYTNVTARAECLKMMNTTTFQKCGAIPNFDVNSFVENCVLDAMMTNGMDWTMQHLESIKEKCIDHVEVMQPLPPEVRAQLVIFPDRIETDDNNGTLEYPTLPPLNESSSSNLEKITPEFLTEIKDVSCPQECNGHGKCIKGTCQCDEPYINFDCSLDKTQPPVMMGIPDKGECDLQNRRCAKTSVFVRNVAETDKLTCRIKRFEIDSNNIIHVSGSTDVPGHYESMYEVYCPLPQSRSRRSVKSDTIDDNISYGCHTSISNDGNSFSDEDSIVIYDSLCVNCTKIDTKIACMKKDGYCVDHGQCYGPGENSGCYICSDSDGRWIAGPDCPSAIEENGLKGWMIGVISASVVVAVLIGLFAVVYIWKRTSSDKRVGGSMTSIQNSTTKHRT